MQVMRCRTLKITQNAFNGSSMRICRSMHKLTNFVNNKANIWYCKSEILKSTHNLTKACSIGRQKIWQYDSF
jgi:hypothetical protein